jgi:integrase
LERARAADRGDPEPLADDATRELADRTDRNVVTPVRTALATARREGLIRHNPADDVALPHRPRVEEDNVTPRPFPTGTMELVVSRVHPDHRLMFELLAATGVRRSELLALEVRHLQLNGDRPLVQVRQRVRRQKGNGLVVGPLKSAYARRELPIPVELADRLRSQVGGREPTDLVFAAKVVARREGPVVGGGLLDPDNLAERVLSPACGEAGVEWAGFHTFRHTVASRMFAEGRNAKQVQKWLGHHSAAFTLNTYVHLCDDDDLGGPLGPTVSQTAPQTEGHRVHTKVHTGAADNRPETAIGSGPSEAAKPARLAG